MGKKRKQKCTVYGVVEDQIEFIEFLKEAYESDENNVNVYIKDANGGTPDRILEFAIRECNRERSFVWLDEDFEPNQTLGKEVRKQLAKYWGVNENLDEFLKCPLADLQKNYNKGNKKPVLIVSKPVCSEAIVIQVLGEDVPDSCKYMIQKKEKYK